MDYTKEYKYCSNCGELIYKEAEICPKCGVRVAPPPNPFGGPGRNRIIAAILALFLGGLGAHKFYLGKIGWGIVYILFCWTVIPTIVGIIEGVRYLVISDEDFNASYNN